MADENLRAIELTMSDKDKAIMQELGLVIAEWQTKHMTQSLVMDCIMITHVLGGLAAVMYRDPATAPEFISPQTFLHMLNINTARAMSDALDMLKSKDKDNENTGEKGDRTPD